MTETEILAERFEANRSHLRSVAYRALGSQTEADDAVQETFLRVMRAGTSGVDNFAGWLTTIVARVCPDMLRGRKSRREVPRRPRPPELPRCGGDGAIRGRGCELKSDGTTPRTQNSYSCLLRSARVARDRRISAATARLSAIASAV